MKQKSISRIDILAWFIIGSMALFGIRLFMLQILEHGKYVSIAKQSQQRSFTLPATRGEIFMKDREAAVPVVLNRAVYIVYADPETVKSSQLDDIKSRLHEVAGGELTKDIDSKLINKGSRYEILAKNITKSQAEKLQKYNFSGVGFQKNSIRNYPEGQLAAQVLGFVNGEGKGQYGIEQSLDTRLHGRDGLLQSVTDVKDVPLHVGKDNIRVEAEAGEDITLSIDRNIQSYAEDALKRGVERAGATEGSVLVMNPNNGQVMAMANFPTFSPQTYYNVSDARVFTDNNTMVPLEPASVIKTFTISTALDKGVITPGSTFYNTDCIAVADRTMCNALRGLGGTTSVQGLINNSLNVGTITFARRLGDGKSINLQARNTIYEYFHDKFGFGEKTGIEVSEVSGLLYSPKHSEGNEVRYSAMTYGQGMNLTMMQVATGFCSVVNGGNYYTPTLIAASSKPGAVEEKPQPKRRTISEKTSNEMRDLLVDARRSTWIGASDPGGFMVGGKTGTAETISQTGEYTAVETVATYVGFGGVEKAEYVIMVRVAAPGKGLNLEGGKHAGPVFSDISNWMIKFMNLRPKG